MRLPLVSTRPGFSQSVRSLFTSLIVICVLGAGVLEAAPGGVTAASDTQSQPGYRFERGGWTYVHLEGTPAEIGYQHGRLLAREIADTLAVIKLENTHNTKRNWEFFRDASRKMLWPHIDAEYQQELKGIARGAQSRGVNIDVWDIVALNGGIELPEYYVPWLNKREKTENTPHI